MLRTLIADDSAAARDGLRSILRVYPDCQAVAEALDGLDAISKAERVRPEVILMDVQMPIMDGVEATRRIKQSLSHIMVLQAVVGIQPRPVFYRLLKVVCEAQLSSRSLL